MRYVRDDPELEQYSQRFFSDDTSPTELLLLLQLTAAVAPPESTEDMGATPAKPEAQQNLESEAQQDIRPAAPTGYDLPLPEGVVSGKGAIAERSAASRDIQEALVDPPIREIDLRPHIPRPRRYLNLSEDLEYPDIE